MVPSQSIRYFTVELPYWLGLGDKLWHLSKLYSLGMALSYTYVHTPFSCPRSTSGSYLGLNLRLIAKNVHSRSKKSDYLGKFLGLEKRDKTIHDTAFNSFLISPVCIDDLLNSNLIDSINDLQQLIEQRYSDKRHQIICLTTRQGIYACEVKLNSLIGGPQAEDAYIEELGIARGYWQAREQKPIKTRFSPGKIKILIHVRNGDTVTFGFKEKLVSVFGSTVRILDKENDIFEVQRKPVSLKKISHLLEEIRRCGYDDFSVIFISDGYSRAVEVILKSLLKREVKLSLLNIFRLLGRVFRLEHDLKRCLKQYGATYIIGESKRDLINSIHAIAEANIIVMSTGGFAYSIYRFLNVDSSTKIGNIHTLSSSEIEAFKLSLKKSGLEGC